MFEVALPLYCRLVSRFSFHGALFHLVIQSVQLQLVSIQQIRHYTRDSYLLLIRWSSESWRKDTEVLR